MFEHLDKQHRMLKPQYKDHLMGIYFKGTSMDGLYHIQKIIK